MAGFVAFFTLQKNCFQPHLSRNTFNRIFDIIIFGQMVSPSWFPSYLVVQPFIQKAFLWMSYVYICCLIFLELTKENYMHFQIFAKVWVAFWSFHEFNQIWCVYFSEKCQDLHWINVLEWICVLGYETNSIWFGVSHKS